MIYNDELMAMRFRNELDKVKRGDLPKTAFTISISDWNLTDGKYLAVISSSDLTADKYVEVFFNDSCSEIVSAAKISTEGETFEGGISITAENLPTDSISGSYYIFKGDSFMSKARVNTGSYQETVFVGATSITSGVAGNVPAPLAGDQDKFLCGNGQWATIPSGGSGGGDLVINGDEVQEVTLIGADYSYDSGTKKASISISGSANFTVNGAEVTAMSVCGAASVSTQSDTAIVSITGGEAKNVTINGAESNIISISGAAQVSQGGGGITNLIIADRTPKLSANFAVTPANVTVPSWTPATISASRLGDGLIKCYDNASYFDINQLSATDFRFLGRKVATVNAGFWLDETADYYGAAKNVNIVVTQGTPDILMHFDDASDIWKNDGNLTATVTPTGSTTASIVEGGKFGSYVNTPSSYRIALALGGDDFTIEYFTKYIEVSTKANDLKVANGFFGIMNLVPENGWFAAPNADRTASLGNYGLGYGLLDWTHIAFCYNHTAGEVKLFVGGKLKKTWEVTYDEMATELSTWPGLDELRIVKGVCIYVEDFTPPTEPF